MALIKVTDTHDNDVYINPDQIVLVTPVLEQGYLYPSKPHQTWIKLRDQLQVTVNGTPEQFFNGGLLGSKTLKKAPRIPTEGEKCCKDCGCALGNDPWSCPVSGKKCRA